MPDNPIARRLITIPTVVALFLAVTAFSPFLVVIAAAIDLTRRLANRRASMALRALAFLWVYLLGQLWALATLLATAVLPREQKLEATYRLQDKWAAWNFTALQRLFSLEIELEGGDAILPGPIIVLSRHASMVDTLLPARLIARPSGLKLRYVLKEELLADPALDIAGTRLPNAFIDRRSRETSEQASIKHLAEDLRPDEAILIYPEGTRFSESKLRRSQRRGAAESGAVGEVVASLRKVLPPRPGGTLALLDATTADIVVMAHRGLEGLATVREIWSGDLVGSQIDVSLWRVPRSTVPTSRSERVEWLYRLWAEVDDWVVSAGPLVDEAPA
jgi:1-acyl-sn-glycerol-3-phosphate acyltransferase